MTIPRRFPDIEKELEAKLVGVKMICLDDSFSDEQIKNSDVLPVLGQVCTIRAVRIAFRSKDDQYHPSFLFDEIINTRLIFGQEPSFWSTRFEPHDSDEEEADVPLAGVSSPVKQ